MKRTGVAGPGASGDFIANNLIYQPQNVGPS